jgi:hypothetical protein
MPFCPQCGASNAAEAAFCGACGQTIRREAQAAQPPAQGQAPAASAAPPPRKVGASTMLGMSSPLGPMMQPSAPTAAAPAPTAPAAPAAPPAAAAPFRQVSNKTMIGMAPLAAPAPAQPAPGASQPLASSKKTLVMGTHGVPLGPVASPVAPRQFDASVPHGNGGSKKTLIGVSGLGGGQAGQASQLAQGSQPSGLSRAKTLFGLAMPGLVPQAPPEPQYVEEEYEEVVPETGEVQRRVRRVAKPPPPLHKRPAFYALLVAGLLLLGGVGAAVFVKSAPPLSAEARLDAEGKDVLHIVCKSCPDDTSVGGPGGVKAVVKNGEAEFRLAEPLKVGPNAVSVAVDRPGAGRDETITVHVPVAYRIWPDVNALQDTIPAVRIDVEAIAGSVVTVQGKPVALDASGRGNARVDVTEALTALPRDARTFEREVAYTIAPTGGSPESGKLQVRVGVVSLTLESPGPQLITDQPTFLLAGRVTKGGGLTAAGSAIPVNADGSFKQHMKISAPGSTEVVLRASANALAPRISSVKVKLVQSLAAEARALDGQGHPGYGDVAAKLEQATGMPVAWRSEVVSANTQSSQTVAVIEVATGCARKPCRARVVLPGGTTLATGDKIGVYGRVGGVVSAGGMRLPDIEADFFVKGP